MATIINNPQGENGNDSGAGIVIGTVVALLVIVLFFVYVFPGLRADRVPAQPTPSEEQGQTNINISTPVLGGNGTTTE